MKKFTAVIGGLTLAAGMAFAQDQAQPQSFEELDQNQDGVITQSEASSSQDLVASFQSADANQDGYLTPAEFDSIQAEAEEAE